jgi:hypothetical protein
MDTHGAIGAGYPVLGNLFVVFPLEQVYSVSTSIGFGRVGQDWWKVGIASLAKVSMSIFGHKVTGSLSDLGATAVNTLADEKSRFMKQTTLLTHGTVPSLA